jgi:hypothetical protein
MSAQYKTFVVFISGQVSEDVAHRMAVFRHHFLSHPGSLAFVASWDKEIYLDPKITWTIQEDNMWEFVSDKVAVTVGDIMSPHVYHGETYCFTPFCPSVCPSGCHTFASPPTFLDGFG